MFNRDPAEQGRHRAAPLGRDTRVLSGLQSRLMHPDLIREYITTWQQAERRETLAARGE